MQWVSFRALALSVLLVAQTTHAFWRLPCNTRLTVERVDPIVNRGAVSGHVHTVSGASNFGTNSTFEDMRNSDCTSCMVKQDMSAYWTPALYFQWANGSFSMVNQVGGGLIYYLQRYHSTDKTEVLAFPDGFRMLTGNPMLRSYTPGLVSDAIGWNCLGGSGRNPWLPTTRCPNGLRGEIRFPSCWNGVDVDSPNHFSHMAYSDGESGPCPSTHPKRTVTLFFEMMWDVDSWAPYYNQAMNKTQPFVVSMGDATGCGYHGDFLNGWDGQVLQTALRQCRDDSGVIEKCPVFDLQASTATCKKTPDVNEIVTGTLPTLPGCNPVTHGPSNATACTPTSTPEIYTSPMAYTGKAQPPGAEILSNTPRVLEQYDVWAYKDCYSDDTANRALSKGLDTKNKTVEACLDACKAQNFALCGVEYHGQCWGGNTLNSAARAIGYGYCDLTCDDNPLQYCGGAAPNTAMELYVRGGPGGSTSTKTSSMSQSTKTMSTSMHSTSTAISTTASTVGQTTKTVSSSTKSSSMSTTATSTTSTEVHVTSSTVTTSSSSPTTTGKLLDSASWTYSGCFSDLVPGRSLPNLLSSNHTIEGCLAASDAAGFALAGLSYKGECWAASALSPTSTRLDASKCQMACSNSPSTQCGGAAALDVYVSKKTPLIKSPGTPDFTEISGYKYTGCYSDLVNNQRSLTKGLSSNSTIEGCISACKNAGLAVCGLEYYGECWGGSALSKTSTVLDATKCSYSCKNNPLERCGGSSSLSVYTLATVQSKRQPMAYPSRRHKMRRWGH